MPEPSIEMKTGPAEAPLVDLTDAERAEIREQAMRAARSCGWLPAQALHKQAAGRFSGRA